MSMLASMTISREDAGIWLSVTFCRLPRTIRGQSISRRNIECRRHNRLCSSLDYEPTPMLRRSNILARDNQYEPNEDNIESDTQK